MSFRRYLSFFFFLFFSCIPFAYSQMPLSPKAEVSILTCDKGNELYALFGHTAIRLHDSARALDVVYNYGTFDFSTENFYLKFVKGDLQYFVTVNSFNDFIFQYTMENRSVYEQVLNLTQAQKQSIFDSLNESLESDKKYYTYKFIDRNCTNMVVDKINATLGQDCIVKTTEKDQSYRQILFPYLENRFFENLGINIIFGKKVDEEGKRLFLPHQFMESLKTASFNGKPLSEEPKTILNVPPSKPETSLWNNIYAFSALLLLLIISRKESIYLIFLGICGVLGLFLSVVGFYSLHEEVALNYNVLLFNPAFLLLIYFVSQKNYKWINRITKFNLVSLIVFMIILFNKPNLVIFLPIILSLVYLQIYFIRKSKSALLPN